MKKFRYFNMKKEIFEMKAEVLQALAHPTRLMILDQLKNGGCCVCKLIPKMGKEQSNISHHLAILRKAGIVECQRKKKEIYYSLNDKSILNALNCLDGFILRSLAEKGNILKKIKKGG